MRWKRTGTQKLRALAAAQDTYEKATAAATELITDAEHTQLLALATDFPRLWRDPRTETKERAHLGIISLPTGTSIPFTSHHL